MCKATSPIGPNSAKAGPTQSGRPGTNYPEHGSTESPEHRYQKLASDT